MAKPKKQQKPKTELTPVEKAKAKAKDDEKAGIDPDVRAEAELIMHNLERNELTRYAPVFTYMTVPKRERIKAAVKLLISEMRMQTFTTGSVYKVLTDDDRAEMKAAADREVAAETAIKRLQEMIGNDVLTGDHVIRADHRDSLPYDDPFFEALADPVALLAWIEAKLKGSKK